MKLRTAAFATLLLAGCGGQGANQQSANQQAGGNQEAGSGQTASTAPVGGGTFTIQPGEWEITMEMHATQATGMPAGMTIPQLPPSTVRSCVTPEQVARANAGFLNGGGHAGMECDYSHVTVEGGRIQGTSSCRRAGMEARVTMDGSFTPTSYDINQQMESTMHGRTMSSANHLVGRRIGECTPGQASAAASGPGNGQAANR